MAVAYPSSTNVSVPSHDATGHLTVSYSRNPKKFALPNYTTLTPIKKIIGLYQRFNAEQAARVIRSDLGEFVWKDGTERPTGNWALEAFTWVKYISERYCYPFTMGRLTVEQAEWPIVAQHSAFMAQQAMTARTQKTYGIISNTANWPTTNVLDQTAAKWTTGTPSNPVIRKALLAGAQVINKGTLGMVTPADLCLVLSPALASAMSNSSEISDYLKNSPFALAQVRGDVPSQNGQWGLPDVLYSFKVVVEDAVRNASLKGVSPQSLDYIWSGTLGALVARPGQLTAMEGTPSFSTIHLLMEEEMSIELFDDPINRRVLGSVVENYACELVTSLSGVIFNNAA